MILCVLMICIGLFAVFYTINGNLIDTSEKNFANAQIESSAESSNIIDLKATERNNHYVWITADDQINPQLDLKLNKEYIIQIESMNNNIPHQLIIQDKNGKQLAKSIEISNGATDDFPFTFTSSGKYQYHCQYHPESMYGDIIVS
ncbi:MAG TPA: cupredoxin domain-containing protein [Nitrososphaeraceae archaeon]|nr:cupredoxin domain-containing protein [Nitrososphaeraceae archaeon]